MDPISEFCWPGVCPNGRHSVLEAIGFDAEHRAASSIYFVIGLFALVLLHTNSVFTLAEIMIPAVISYIFRWSIRILNQFYGAFPNGRKKAAALIVSAINSGGACLRIKEAH